MGGLKLVFPRNVVLLSQISFRLNFYLAKKWPILGFFQTFHVTTSFLADKYSICVWSILDTIGVLVCVFIEICLDLIKKLHILISRDLDKIRKKGPCVKCFSIQYSNK